MAEKIVSPGVFTRENDFSFVPQGIAEIGAAIIGPTTKGPALVPTVVNSFSEFEAIFGTTFDSGSKSYEYFTSLAAEQYLKNSGTLTVVRVMKGSFTGATSSATQSGGANASSNAFKLKTIGDGAVMNSVGAEPAAPIVLANGTANNYRWEVQGLNTNTGTFNLLIRQGNDTHNKKRVLETWNNLSLDPNQSNYIGKVIGTAYATMAGTGTDVYIDYQGSFPRKSRYVYVDEASITDTIDWYDADGGIRVAANSNLLPANGSGSFGGGNDGDIATGSDFLMYDKIANGKVQGYDPDADYIDAINLLANPDEYDVNLIVAPGMTAQHDGTATSRLLTVCEERGDCMAIVDPVIYGTAQSTVITEAASENNSYGAMYWPWIQIPSNRTGKNVWVPPSVVMPAVYAFSDSVAAEWYAPAGLNRGGIDNANRDLLYEGKVNPLATFPGEGVCAWGQKTLQKKASALDRINVRRLLINLKKFIASTSRYLVFENNTEATRNRFLAAVNPYMETVQQNQGLYAFKVVMDTTNNTPDVIDRNILKGDIYIQPAKAAEFIIVDFNIMPTGATFGE